jgi:chromosome partitioning protein
MINQARPQGDRADQSIEFLASKGLTVCPYSFGYRVAFEDADTTGQTPQETEPRGKAAAEISAVYRYTIETLNHLTIEGTNYGKGFSRTLA